MKPLSPLGPDPEGQGTRSTIPPLVDHVPTAHGNRDPVISRFIFEIEPLLGLTAVQVCNLSSAGFLSSPSNAGLVVYLG